MLNAWVKIQSTRTMGNYQILEQIGATAGGTLHHARHVQDGTAALVKLPAHGSATDSLRHEYTLLQSLDVPEILKPIALHEDGARLALVLEPFADESLETVLARQPRFPLPDALTLASQLTRALVALHAAGITHGDLRPANHLLARDGVQVKLADLSRAVSREGATSSRRTAAVDWAYMSPEQTGRMNRQADYRTDFYSLGILLYRLLTGQLPFQASDPLEWVHCHLARLPVPPHRLLPDIPQVVSDLVQKLLAKVPEERYQSASGLLADLEQCLGQWRESEEIAPFALGMRDVSDRFQIPSRLYGRAPEKAALLAAFEPVATTGTPMLVTVAGYSGVGKSALVNELQQPINEKRGYFIASKFDQYKRDIPYATLAQAFDRLVRQLLGESDAAVGQWRQALCEALKPNGQLMVNLIPQLELIIGPQSPVPDLPAQDALRRFQLVFRRFVGVFAKQEHPLVLFLDDVQWADAATLAVLADLATHPDVRYLLLVGAYRDNEVDSSHPLRHRLAAIRQAGGAVQSIVLAPLVLDDVAQLVAESMHCSPAQAEPLAQLVLNKTGGNPFFTRQFLATLAEEKLLQFDASHHAWRWNLPRIQAKRYTDNVVDLMVDKLDRLPQDTQDALFRFACLGNSADAATLGLVLEHSTETVHALLWEAERAGLVCRQEESYTFLHDRVQEAAYSRILENARAGMHLRIGRILVSGLAPEAIAERIFDVVNQLNRGSALVALPQERERIAELNLLAGQRAKAATAYTSALAYLTTGAALLEDDCWERRHDLVFQLELNRAECEFLTSALAQAEERLTALSGRAATTVEQAAVTCLRADLYANLGRHDQVVRVGLDFLRGLGIDWPLHPTDEDVLREYEQVWSRLGKRQIEELIDLPLMTDPIPLAIKGVLAKIGPAAMFVHANLSSLLICKAVNFSLEHGNCDVSCASYASIAMLAAARFGDHPSADRFARLSLDLVDQRGLKGLEAYTCQILGNFVIPWVRHIKTGGDLLRRAFSVGNRIGDLIFAAFSCAQLSTNLLAAGDPLDEVQREAEHGLAFAQKMQFDLVINSIAAQLGFIRTLRGLTPALGIFDDDEFDETLHERRLASNPGLRYAEYVYWIRKLQARFLGGDYDTAIAAASRARELQSVATGQFDTAEYHFYSALSHAASCAAHPCTADLEALAGHRRQLDVWAAGCPENFENRAALVGAEIARLEGRALEAQHLYEQAIRSARDNGFVHNEAIAHERASAFYRTQGFEQIADLYLHHARNGYVRWGAHGKVKQLEERYPQLRTHTQRMAATPAANEAQLDLLSVAKASQAISGQILLDELIDTLMRIVLENAGAQTGSLLLARGDELALVAEAEVRQQAVQVMRHTGQALPPSQLPLAMLQYVRRSGEPVLLMEATAPHPFLNDPYFSRRHPQSVLCLPILRQSALVGILYLENSLATHAFTPDRVQVLELLASQAAISLDNARLYADVRDSHARIRRLVESNIIGILFWDLNGDITDANDAFLRMTGYAREDVTSGALCWTQITPPQYREVDARVIEELKRTGSAPPFEKEYIRKDGSRIPILIGVTLSAQSEDSGIAFVLDLTERKQAEAEREARHAAEAANRAKTTFLAVANHDLRQPMHALHLYLGALTAIELPEPARPLLANVTQCAHIMDEMFRALLDLSRLDAKVVAPHIECFPIASLLSRMAVEFTPQANAKGLDMHIQPSAAWVETDASLVAQILGNLVANAVRYTDAGSIAIFCGSHGGKLRVTIQDTGIGIPRHQQEIVFEEFSQVGNVGRDRTKGLGLGLAIVRRLCCLLGVPIMLHSVVGQGSLFSIDLPQVSSQTAAPAPDTTPVADAELFHGKMVVVVDDEESILDAMRVLIEQWGCLVMTAKSGDEAVAKLGGAGRLPDALICDWRLRLNESGFDVISRMWEEFNHRIPALLITADTSPERIQETMASGLPVLYKPVKAGDLWAALGQILRG